MCCRFVVATTTSKSVLLWTLLGPVTVAGSLGTPVQTIAIKRFTTEGNRGFAFSLFYSFMNMAALLCASVLDLFRVRLRHGFNIASLPATHFLNDGTRLLLFMGASAALPPILAFSQRPAVLKHAGPVPCAAVLQLQQQSKEVLLHEEALRLSP